MKISVIIPTYRPRSYLWECLESLKIQTFPKDDFEIILVLNGCNEPYHSQIEGYLSLNMSDNIVNFIHLDQGGVSNARNVALNCARGEYIAFVDDDDFVSPSYLTELYGLANPDTIPLCYPYAFVDGSIKQIKYPITTLYDDRHNKGKQIYRYARKYFSGPWMKLIPKSYIQERRFDVRFKNGEDALFNFLISDKFRFVDFTTKDAVYYRRYRSDSAVTSKRSIWEKICNSMNLLRCYLNIYFSAPNRYSLNFLFTRCLAAIHSIIG